MRTTLIALAVSLLSRSAEVAAQTAAALAYAPTFENCPSGTSLVRQVGSNAGAQTLSAGEAQYVSARQSSVIPEAWANYLANVQKNCEVKLPAYVDAILLGARGQNALPTLGIATSGGGYRAAIFGAGVLNTLDGRNKTSADAGVGGLLQAATYLSGLSGGSWLVSSLAQADFPTFPELIFGPSVPPAGNAFNGWLTEFDLLAPGGDNATLTAEYISDVLLEVAVKWAKGFPVTITDVWARALSRHFANGTTAANFFDSSLTHGAGITFSSIASLSTFADHTQPFPIIIADSLTSRSSGSVVTEPGDIVPLTNPIYEFNVFETGSFDPALGAFTPTELLGSPNNSLCVKGLDQSTYLAGISSNVFNGLNTSAAALAASLIGPLIEAINESFPQVNIRLDSGVIPNPFFGVSSATFPDSDQKVLTLVDGGEDGETTPFQPLLVKARGVDTIIAIDAPADTAENWAAGLSLVATQDRVKKFSSTYSFPPVPSSSAGFLANNLTLHPTFFGCNSPASSGDPLVVYIANGGPPLGEAPVTNTSTDQLQYPFSEVQAMLNQVFDIATQGIPVESHSGLEKDPEWSACLACAVVDRARRNAGIERSGVCASCLQRYCWS